MRRLGYDPIVLHRVTLYGRAGCHLCDEVRDVIVRVAARMPLRLEEVDIDRDPELRAEYDTEVPVVEVNGREIARWRLDELDLVRALGAAAPTEA